ncbi:MAG: magnesium chelatase [Calditrichaeota bacterium]|nr:MAG: magnesium chelatase [Calditrichota bacterium]MBL1203836.1 magnesium chelatase [Calditrichota bacterium]NOG43667.1 magnesium chelatase [Calditrichota bacterium]
MLIKNHDQIKTLGQLKNSGYYSRSIKDEMRDNLVKKLSGNEKLFQGIIGYEETVIPELERALLSRHNIIFLGLRGQAKTRMARLLDNLLDAYIPVISETELNDDPMNPVSRHGKQIVKEQGDETPIDWMHRSQRYTEKLATPDVTVADLIGDVDPIKAASLKLHYSDEKVIHFGLIPRSNRCIFVINELPDLQARIQVALFNILQEEDIQIRGFKLRLPLDIQFVFTANPEDYTNRGSIVTPLKDRIDSQILTHYPREIEHSMQITQQEARLTNSQKENVCVPELLKTLIEEIAFQARESEYIDENSGVSARLTISAYENLISTAERRMLLNKEDKAIARILDLYGVIPSITGKVELVYEGEQEGPLKIAHILINNSIQQHFKNYFPDPDKTKKTESVNPYQEIVDWFGNNNTLDLLLTASDKEFKKLLNDVPGLKNLVQKYHTNSSEEEINILMEFALFGLAEHSFLSKVAMDSRLQFKDILSSMLKESGDDYANLGNQDMF